MKSYILLIITSFILLNCNCNDNHKKIQEYDENIEILIEKNKYLEALKLQKKKISLKTINFYDYELAANLAFKAKKYEECIVYLDSFYNEIKKLDKNQLDLEKFYSEKYYLKDLKDISLKNIFINLEDTSLIAQHLRNGFNLFTTNEEGESLIMRASEKGLITVLSFIKNNGVNIDTYVHFLDGDSPIMRTAKKVI